MQDVNQRLLCMQGMERIQLPKVPFLGNGKKAGGDRKKDGGRRTRPLKAVQRMREWARAQAIMLYAVEHDELWIHKGFHDVRASMPAGYCSSFHCFDFVFRSIHRS